MGLFDELKDQFGGLLKTQEGAETAATHPGLLAGVVELIEKQGLASLLQSFKDKGLSETVASWVGKGRNLPISADQLQSVLNPEAIDALAQKAGIPPGQVSALLAKILPGMVDHLTPGGSVEGPAPSP